MTLAAVTPVQLGFPHAVTVIAVKSAVTDKKTGVASGETRHFVSSLERGALTPRQWLARCRGHWSVESANHYRRDVTWREDAELGRNARRACTLALLRFRPPRRPAPRRLPQPLRPLAALCLPSCCRLALPSLFFSSVLNPNRNTVLFYHHTRRVAICGDWATRVSLP